MVWMYIFYIINSAYIRDHQDCYFYAAQAYLNTGNLDSAIYFVNLSHPIITKDSVLYFRTKSMIEEKLGRHPSSKKDAEIAGSIADRAILAQSHHNLSKVENEPIQESFIQKNKKLNKKYFYLMTLLVITLTCFLFSGIWIRRKYLWLKQEQLTQQTRLLLAKKQLEDTHRQLMQQRDTAANDELSPSTFEILRLQAKCIESIFKNTIYSGMRGTSIFKYIFEMENEERKSLMKISIDDSFWSNLDELVNLTYPHSFEQLAHDGVRLSKKEIQLIKLDLLRIPNAVIAVLLDYADYSTASVRQRTYNKIGCRGLELSEFLMRKSNEFKNHPQ